MRPVLSTLIGLGALALAGCEPAAAQEQAPCGPYEDLAHALLDRYHEKPVGEGTAGAGKLLIFISPEGKTWTAVAVIGKGACIIASGTNWQPVWLAL